MVQGETVYSSQSYNNLPTRTPEARKAGYEAIQKMEKKKDNKDYGAWGPTFKNKNHFASLHHC